METAHNTHTQLSGVLGFVSRGDMIQAIHKLEDSLRRDLEAIDGKITALENRVKQRIDTSEQEIDQSYRGMEAQMDKMGDDLKEILHTFEENMHDTQMATTRQMDRMQEAIAETKQELDTVHKQIESVIGLLERHQEAILDNSTHTDSAQSQEINPNTETHIDHHNATDHHNTADHNNATDHHNTADHHNNTDQHNANEDDCERCGPGADPHDTCCTDHSYSFFRSFNSQRPDHQRDGDHQSEIGYTGA